MGKINKKQRTKADLWTVLLSTFIYFTLAETSFSGQYEDGKAALDRHDYAEALRDFRALAEERDVRAQHLLGFMYYYGVGVPQNYGIAAKWYLKAAEQGYVLAQVDLGLMYGSGKGVRQNYGEAFRWFRVAVEQGNAVAQYNLGIAYANGFGVPQNYVQAHMWFNLAAANATDKPTLDEATRNRDILAAKMNPEQIAEAQRLATEWKPKEP